jgi:CheY-like chemotaxis protein
MTGRPWWLRLDGVPPWWPGQHQRSGHDLIDLSIEAKRQPTLLVVDDEPDIREWLSVALSVLGWRVEEAATGFEALDRVEVEVPDVIVLDHRMPHMTGLQCAAELREAGVHVPILLFSAFVAPDAMDEARRLDVMPVSKVDPSSLLATIAVLREEIDQRALASTIDLTSEIELRGRTLSQEGRLRPHR